MNETMQQLYERKSVRVFEEKDIPAHIKQYLIEAALQAPTAGNQILYSIIDIQDAVLKKELAESCDNQPFIATAPLVLVFLADCRRWYDAFRLAGAQPRQPGVGDLLLAFSDATIAAQNTVVAAQSFGLGSCYIGDILENRERVAELLHLDNYTVPAAMLVYGWPTRQQRERKKQNRFAPEYIVQVNQYQPLPEQKLRDMFEKRSGQQNFQFEPYLQNFCERKYMADFSLEMSRSVAEYLRRFVPFLGCEE